MIWHVGKKFLKSSVTSFSVKIIIVSWHINSSLVYEAINNLTAFYMTLLQFVVEHVPFTIYLLYITTWCCFNTRINWKMYSSIDLNLFYSITRNLVSYVVFGLISVSILFNIVPLNIFIWHVQHITISITYDIT